jgi:hypothetical protein
MKSIIIYTTRNVNKIKVTIAIFFLFTNQNSIRIYNPSYIFSFFFLSNSPKFNLKIFLTLTFICNQSNKFLHTKNVR